MDDKEFAPWMGDSAYRTAQQYSWINRSTFYNSINPEYRLYMQRWVMLSLQWYDGFVPGFHRVDRGIFSTHIGQAIVQGLASKVIGGQIYYKTAKRETPVKGADGKYKVNPALDFIANEFAAAGGLTQEVKRAITYAAAGGTALLKLDKHEGQLRCKAMRFDSFYPVVGYGGELLELTCYCKEFTRLDKGGTAESYYVVEHRYFDDYVTELGDVVPHASVVRYEVIRSTGTATVQDYGGDAQRVELKNCPRGVRSSIAKAFDGIALDRPILLPFDGNLGAVLINWTDGVTALPELPFGDSLLYPIQAYLQSYDYYFSAFNTDMYLGRGRVIAPSYMQTARGTHQQNTGLDSMIFTKAPGYSESQSLTPVQFDLRTTSWREIRDMLLQNIAFSVGVNVSALASCLDSGGGMRTAHEVTADNNETAVFIANKREILERPINRLIKMITAYYGYTDTVVIRWAETALGDIYTRTEVLTMAVQNGLVSRQTAANLFRQDDDEYQMAEEWEKIEADRKSQGIAFGGGLTLDEYARGLSDDGGGRDRQDGASFAAVDRDDVSAAGDAVGDTGGGGEDDRR